MKIFIFTLLTICFINAKSQNTFNYEEKIYGLSLIWQEVNYNFAYLRESDVNWDSLYIATIPKVESSANIEEYYDILSQFLCVFHEGHTFVIKPVINNSKYGVVSIYPYWYKGKYYVVGYSAEYKKKLELGAEIVEINGMPTLEYFNKYIFPLYNVPSHSANEYLAFKLFYGKKGNNLEVKFKNPNGKSIKLSISRKSSYEDLINKPPKIFSKKAFDYKRIDGYDYVRIGSFNKKISNQFESLVDSLKKSNGIIIDLRSNSGGNSGVGSSIVQYFTTAPSYINGAIKARVNNSYYKALSVFNYGTKEKKYIEYFYFDKYEEKLFHFENKTNGELSKITVVILINGATASSAESFVIEMKRIKNVTIIGTPSYGSTTLPLIHNLPFGGKVYIATQMTLDENNNEYKFIKPDILVSVSVENRIKGVDEVLNRAILFLELK